MESQSPSKGIATGSRLGTKSVLVLFMVVGKLEGGKRTRGALKLQSRVLPVDKLTL